MGWGDKIIGNWFGEAAAPPAPTPPPQSQAERDAERIANLKIAEEKAAPFLEFAERLKNIPPDADGKIFRLEMRDRSFAEVSLAVVFGPGGDRGPRSSWEYSSLTVTIAHDRIRVSDYNDEGAGPFDKRCKTVDEAIPPEMLDLLGKLD